MISEREKGPNQKSEPTNYGLTSFAGTDPSTGHANLFAACGTAAWPDSPRVGDDVRSL